MNSKNWTFVAALLCGVAFAAQAQAALVMTDTSDQTQDFDFLSRGSAIFWDDNQSPEGTAGSPGWYWQDTQSGVPYFVDDGTEFYGEGYSYGTDGATDRAMGSLNQDSNADIAWGVAFENSSGQEITSITVSYTGEQWRARTGGIDTLAFSYRVDGSEITDFDPGGGAAPSGWTSVAGLDFEGPNTGDSGAIDGNLGGNQESLSETISLTLADGEFLSLRWHDGNVSSLDDGLAIDDLTVSFTVAAVPEPAAALIFGCVVLGFRTLRRKES